MCSAIKVGDLGKDATNFDILGVKLGDDMAISLRHLKDKKHLSTPPTISTVHGIATKAVMKFENGEMLNLHATARSQEIFQIHLAMFADRLTPFPYFCDRMREELNRKYGPPALTLSRTRDDTNFSEGLRMGDSIDVQRQVWGAVKDDPSTPLGFQTSGPSLRVDCSQEGLRKDDRFVVDFLLTDEQRERDDRDFRKEMEALDGKEKLEKIITSLDF